MQARMKNPAMVHPDVLQPLMAVAKALKQGSVPERTLELVHLRASQINGCAFCVDMGVREARKGGETDDRLHAVAVWRESPLFNDAERAALAFAEAATRLSDRSDPVPDDVWNAAARHYEEPALAQLVLFVAMTNMWNRINVPVRQVPGAGW
ncbi:carboxymuconolactone decarboxylase family protein [Myxococcus sp. Y35]|uniref:carboxymuconolactone decarboxylase family protein n=1 Tax=Pseudomyxococcus flavus TaxID=3115648 RepID=UPI003CF20B17